MTIPVGGDTWDLARVQQIVIQNELERGRIEYKRELGNGRKTLEAITALGNTFGGVVLVGVDEDKQGLERLTGVPADQRTRLVSMCWSQLTPPFSPEIMPISLGHDDLYVLAVVVDTDYIRRPVMLNQGNKILVRLEDQNQEPDWYRLRDLFTEQAPGSQDIRLPPADPAVSTRQGQYPYTDLALRGRLLLIAPRGRPSVITDTARSQALATLNSNDTPLTGNGSALVNTMHQMVGRSFDVNRWQLEGRSDIRQFSARWYGLAPSGRALTEARIRIEITPRPAQGDTLLITVHALLADPRRFTDEDLGIREPGPPPFSHTVITPEVTAVMAPVIGIGVIRKLMLDITGTLWGQPGDALSADIFGQPLGPPALLDLTIYTTPIQGETEIPPLNQLIDFGVAQLIPGNEPGTWTSLGPVQPDRTLLSSPAAQAPLIHDWLVQFGTGNGYHNIEQEVSRWT